MIFAGIGWTDHGFEVVVVDGEGKPQGPPAQIPSGRLGALTDHLVALHRGSGSALACVVESTNGMVDGGLMAAGLRVHRADPWHLPPRPRFGSVDAATLARIGARRLSELPRLVLDGGSLTGRSDEHARWVRESEPATAELIAARRCVVRADAPDGDALPIALTFDDGPRPPHTGRVLDVLDRYGVPATFFCVGLHAHAHTEELDRMAEAGHRVGNHTWSHPFLPDLSPADLAVQLDRTDEAIARAGSTGGRLFRPPYGSRTPEILDWFAEHDRGSTMVLWDVDTGDWAMPGADTIARRALAQARPGSIVLMHDGGGDRSQTAEALPAIIEGLLERGHRFGVVDDLLG